MRWGNGAYRVLFHCTVWTAIVVCILLLGPRPPAARQVPVTSIQIIWGIVPLIGLFYLHANWLMPVYFFRRRMGAYFGWLTALVILSGLISGIAHFFHEHQRQAGYGIAVGRRLMAAVLFLMASALMAAFRDNARLERERKERETEHLRAELSFLRGQVNPHFMLNVLNSMVLMARKQPASLEPALLELAGLMNYMLYDAAHEKIRLEDELEYLRVYVDLQMLRFRDDVAVIFDIPDNLPDGYIEPMLLIPLVENAFKHGIGLVDEPQIHIGVGMTDGGSLVLTVRNKYNDEVRKSRETAGGIGLINLRKRLDIIYPDRYGLDITTNGWYHISLKIPLE